MEAHARALADARRRVDALRHELFGLECADDYAYSSGAYARLAAELTAAETLVATLEASHG